MSDTDDTGAPVSTSLWSNVPRGTWIGLGIGAGTITLSMWWGVHVEASERARIAAEGEATMQGPLLFALFGILVPIVISLVVGAGVGGSFSVRAALARPAAPFGQRFLSTLLPALAFSVGTIVAAGIGAALAALATGAFAGVDPEWGAPLVSGAIAAAVAAVAALACVTIASLVAGIMLRPARR